MSKRLDENIGTVDYDGLIVTNEPVADVVTVTLAASQVIYALSNFLIMILSWLVKQSLRAFLFQEVQL